MKERIVRLCLTPTRARFHPVQPRARAFAHLPSPSSASSPSLPPAPLALTQSTLLLHHYSRPNYLFATTTPSATSPLPPPRPRPPGYWSTLHAGVRYGQTITCSTLVIGMPGKKLLSTCRLPRKTPRETLVTTHYPRDAELGESSEGAFRESKLRPSERTLSRHPLRFYVSLLDLSLFSLFFLPLIFSLSVSLFFSFCSLRQTMSPASTKHGWVGGEHLPIFS